MPFQSVIIDIIKSQILANTLCDSRFAGGSINGIAYDGTEADASGIRVYPVVYDLTGNGSKVNPDDTYPI